MHLFYLYLSFILCSLCCRVLSHSSHCNFFLLTTCLKGKMDSSHCHSDIRLQLGFFCVRVSCSMSIISHTFVFSSLLSLVSSIALPLFCLIFYTVFSSSFVILTFFFLLFSLPPSVPLRLRVAWHCSW